MALSGFAPSAQSEVAASSQSQTFPIPGSSPTNLVVVNLSFDVIYVLLGNSSVTVTLKTGMPILPRSQQVFTVGTNTNIALITGNQSQSSPVSLTSGS